jgi:hypothetical protein
MLLLSTHAHTSNPTNKTIRHKFACCEYKKKAIIESSEHDAKKAMTPTEYESNEAIYQSEKARFKNAIKLNTGLNTQFTRACCIQIIGACCFAESPLNRQDKFKCFTLIKNELKEEFKAETNPEKIKRLKQEIQAFAAVLLDANLRAANPKFNHISEGEALCCYFDTKHELDKIK